MLLAEVEVAETVVRSGVGLGSAIAIVCSWERNRSILYAILAGFSAGSTSYTLP
jgi:hypothetical protein